MLKKTVKYVDFDGNERTEDFYFNLTKAELAQLELSESGGLTQMLNKIVAEQDIPKIAEYFKKIVMLSYGEKSADGRKFMKSPEILANFMATEAYSELYMELATTADAASAFINGIVPQKMD